jgi:hypothetical protein
VSLFLCGSWRHYNYETTETQRHREQKKEGRSCSLKKGKKNSVSLFLCGSWRHYNYETTETQRHREQKKEVGIVLPEKR